MGLPRCSPFTHYVFAEWPLWAGWRGVVREHRAAITQLCSQHLPSGRAQVEVTDTCSAISEALELCAVYDHGKEGAGEGRC